MFGPYPQQMDRLFLLAVAGWVTAEVKRKNPPVVSEVTNGVQRAVAEGRSFA
jgi:hypothetical protein